MQLLMNDNLLFESNTRHKMVAKKRTIPVQLDAMVYKLEKLFATQFPDNYTIDFRNYVVKSFSLESLMEIISVVESKLKKGIRKNFLFYSEFILVMTDNLTVSITEYVIYYYKRKYGVNIYIVYGKVYQDNFECGLNDYDMKVKNSFFIGEAGRGFIRDSFLLNWFLETSDISEEDFYCKNKDTHRLKLIIGNGPWDASIAISECSDFLENANVHKKAVDAVCDVIGELAPNAVEHGNSNCILDLCYERSISLEGRELTDISIIIYNFSEKLLWTDLHKKIFVNYNDIVYKRERIDKIRKAWIYHKNHFSKSYGEKDFYNLMAFQKISGRCGDSNDGGLGINTLIQNVQKYSTDDYCYVLSGNGALLMDRDITNLDSEDYVAFNKEKKFVDKIPDDNAVMQTKFYMPGVAYNLTFYFEEIK